MMSRVSTDSEPERSTRIATVVAGFGVLCVGVLALANVRGTDGDLAWTLETYAVAGVFAGGGLGYAALGPAERYRRTVGRVLLGDAVLVVVPSVYSAVEGYGSTVPLGRFFLLAGILGTVVGVSMAYGGVRLLRE